MHRSKNCSRIVFGRTRIRVIPSERRSMSRRSRYRRSNCSAIWVLVSSLWPEVRVPSWSNSAHEILPLLALRFVSVASRAGSPSNCARSVDDSRRRELVLVEKDDFWKFELLPRLKRVCHLKFEVAEIKYGMQKTGRGTRGEINGLPRRKLLLPALTSCKTAALSAIIIAASSSFRPAIK